jgi:LPS sulfotransferase NodH
MMAQVYLQGSGRMSAPEKPAPSAAAWARPTRNIAAVELQRLRHKLKLLRRYWLALHRPHTPLFVLATYRSGSNLLLDYLRSLPEVQCYSEVLSPRLPIGLRRIDQNPKLALQHLRYSLQSLQAPVRGCKLMLDQLTACRLAAGDLIEAFPTARYIVLYRESLAEQLLSARAARETGQWVVHRGHDSQQVRIAIDPLELQWFCEETRRLYDSLLADGLLRSGGLLLSYEELVADPAAVFAERICPLLGISPREPRTTMLKQNPRPLPERIVNYAELESLLDSPHCRLSYRWRQSPVKRSAA